MPESLQRRRSTPMRAPSCAVTAARASAFPRGGQHGVVASEQRDTETIAGCPAALVTLAELIAYAAPQRRRKLPTAGSTATIGDSLLSAGESRVSTAAQLPPLPHRIVMRAVSQRWHELPGSCQPAPATCASTQAPRSAQLSAAGSSAVVACRLLSGVFYGHDPGTVGLSRLVNDTNNTREAVVPQDIEHNADGRVDGRDVTRRPSERAVGENGPKPWVGPPLRRTLWANRSSHFLLL